MSWKTLQADLSAHGYIANDALAMAMHLSVQLERPLLLEGAAGVGKTEVAKKLASINNARLIRLQCYWIGSIDTAKKKQRRSLTL